MRFFAFNRNKRGVTLDLPAPVGREAFLGLVRRADILIESAGPGEMTLMGLGFEALREVNPRLVYVAISPYGQEGPYAGFAATDLTLAAMGGSMALQGTADRPPLRVSVPQSWLHAGAEAATAAMVAHRRMLRTGDAQFVDVSAQACMVWTCLNAMAAHAVQGADFVRSGSTLQTPSGTLRLVYECQDGYVLFNPRTDLAKLVHWWIADGVTPKEWETAEDWNAYTLRAIQGLPTKIPLAEVVEANRRLALLHTKGALMERALRDNVTVAPVLDVEGIRRFPQLKDRGYWLSATLPNGRSASVPGLFARVSPTGMSVRRWAPRLGEHNAEMGNGVPDASLKARDDPHPSLPPERGKEFGEGLPPERGKEKDALPFEGVKVLEFTWYGVAPITAKYLADHGATAVRVETAGNIDALRLQIPFKDKVVGLDRSQFFAEFNTSKLGLTLNVKTREGLDIARRLLAWADVYLESFTPGAVDALGIGYDAARALNPSIIMVSTCLMGQTGPARAFRGFGYHAGAMAGFYEVTGWPDRAPDGPYLAYTDVIAPRFLGATVMAALDHRRRTGQGQYIDAAQMEMALHFLAPEIIDYEVNGRVATRMGNRSLDAAPHGVYPCAGGDPWIAIAIETDAQWRALRKLLRDPDWMRNPSYDTAAGRLRGQDIIDPRLAEWTRTMSPHAAMWFLQSEGIPAGAVQRSSDLLKDPQLAHRRFHRYLEHPEMGVIPYSGHQFRIREYDSGPRAPAPTLGQHNDAVLRGLLGLTDAEIEAAVIAGALS